LFCLTCEPSGFRHENFSPGGWRTFFERLGIYHSRTPARQRRHPKTFSYALQREVGRWKLGRCEEWLCWLHLGRTGRSPNIRLFPSSLGVGYGRAEKPQVQYHGYALAKLAEVPEPPMPPKL